MAKVKTLKETTLKMITISARMQALADMVTAGSRVCDLGCDHGYLSIYLIQRGISPHVLAMDVGKGPLGRASEHILRTELCEYITLRLSDGLTQYEEGEADTLICAGMGGALMQRILEREIPKTESFRELILQPQSEITAFRRFLAASGWSISEENIVFEDGKFYPMMKVYPARKGPEEREAGDIPSELAERFGPVLLKKRHPVLWEYLKREWKKCGELKDVLEKAPESPQVQQRMKELLKEMTYLKEVAGLYGKDYN